MSIPVDITDSISQLLPSSLPAETRMDMVQDLIVLVYEGKIDPERLADGIREHLPELKRRYPSLMFQLSLDAPVNRAEGTTMTLHDVITKPGVQPKRRGKRIGRPKAHVVEKAKCENCGELFYWKHYAGRKRLNKKKLHRLSLLPSISPTFWTEEDIEILRIGNPQLLGESGKSASGRTGRFCSRTCLTKFFRDKRQKLPCREELLDLYLNKRLSTCKIAKMYGVTDPCTVRKALLGHGVTLRSVKDSKTQTCTSPDCQSPVHRIKHAGNGAEYGTLCKHHWALHRAELGRWQRRKDNAIPPERWRYQHERGTRP